MAGTEPYTRSQDTALLVVRVVVGAVFMYAGTAKWAFWSAPPQGLSGTLLKIMLLLSIVEPLGSAALLLGVLTRWAASGLGIIMVGSLYFVRSMMHAGVFTSTQGTGLDYNLLLLAGCIALAAFGAGKWSVDAILQKTSPSPIHSGT